MLLSLSIPTYNRSKLIRKTIENLVNEINSYNLNQICRIDIFDNCSQDDTISVCNSFLLESNVNYKIYDSPNNLGAELNFDRCVRYPNADYCWIFGSDDLIIDGALKKICEFLLLFKPKGGITVNYIIDYGNNKVSNFKLFTPDLGNNKFEISNLNLLQIDKNKRNKLISLSLGYLPFISSTIIKRNAYLENNKKANLLNGEGYDFIPWFFRVLKTTSWTYSAISAVRCRRDETNLDDASGFYGKDATNAYRVNIALFKIIFCEFQQFKSKFLLNEFIRSFTWRYVMGDLIRMKINFSNDREIKYSLEKYIKIVRSKYKIKKISFTFFTVQFLSTLNPLYFKIIKKLYKAFK